MKIINHDTIKKLNISPDKCYEWIDFATKNRQEFVMPTKTRIPLLGVDYFNIMPCVMPKDNIMGLKVVTRSEKRHEEGGTNLDAQILLYSYDRCDLLAIMDANYITTMRTAAVAVHTLLNCVDEYESIAMIGLGNIGTVIGDILFDKLRGKKVTVKLYKYKDHAEKFIERFSRYDNIEFVICDNYIDLMGNSDVVFSSVTYIEEDFCDASIYKKGCTVLPVHMRGFLECDLKFDHIITSDMKSITKFKYYNEFKKLSLLDDVIFDMSKVRKNKGERVIIYNLGLALNDIYFADQIYRVIEETSNTILNPKNSFYS